MLHSGRVQATTCRPSDRASRTLVSAQMALAKLSEAANAHGGMLVLTTSIPDAREWAQWKGRTARQDRPGQYMVFLSADDEPFCNEPGLAAKMRGLPDDEIISELLRRKDASIEEALGTFESQQARGAWQNELCEKYYKANVRSVDAAWPSAKCLKTDVKLRDMLALAGRAGPRPAA